MAVQAQANPPKKTSGHMFSTVGSFQPLSLKPISNDLQLIKIDKKTYLEIRKLQGYTLLKLMDHSDGGKIVVNERVFTGSIDWIKVLSPKIYVLNLGNLYVFGMGLTLFDLPANLGDIHRIVVN